MDDRWPYDGDTALQQLTSSISTCRDSNCLVAQRHPFYPVPHDPPLYHGQRPCLPVVPTYLARGRVMIIGEYPNCRFATVRDEITGRLELFVPIADINEPFESGRYFNGHQVQLYPTGKSLQDSYFGPLGLNLGTDVWLTNMVKCFLMQTQHIATYQQLGWVGPDLPQPTSSYDDYFAIAGVCAGLHLARELAECQPKLVIGLGEKVYRMMHSSDDLATPAPDPGPFGVITGVPLRAGFVDHQLDTRNLLFRNLNVVHLFHPSGLIRFPAIRDQHFNQDIPAARAFMEELGLI
ncbi:MAG: hypothetical protein L0346_31605, partial [Chloroflexi bacterium]|nr:hypothetical protein [Chloroflexota bacterium]